ncbi:MAG: hypothetical protein WBG43_01915 [Marinifilaceae bacterium]
MKKIFITILVFCICIASYAQKYPTGLTEMNPEIAKVYSNIKRANIKVNSKLINANSKTAITFIDNSYSEFFPPVFNQVGGSCAYASGVGYIYNYEYNALYELDGKKSENIFNYLQVYAQLNNGKDVGGQAYKGWDFIKINGAPSLKHGKTKTLVEWKSGYDYYYDGMNKGVIDYSVFYSEKDGEIEKMKQYLLDKGNGSKHGGLIQFSAWAHPLEPTLYEGIHSEHCDAMIHHFGNDGMHSMTIVGFDDEVGYDYDNNGIVEGKEKGSFICCNTWGEDWGYYSRCKTNKGRFYAPYYAFTTLKQSNKGVSYSRYNMGGGTGNGDKSCLIVNVKKVECNLVAKIKMSHSSRNDIEFEIGVSNKEGALKPEHTFTSNFMKHQGGDNSMTANYSSKPEVIEIGLNISSYRKYMNMDNAKFFIKVKNKSIGTAGKGKLMSCSIIDYSTEKPTEYFATIKDSELSGSKVSEALVNAGYPNIEKDINSSVRCDIDVNNKKIALFINSSVNTPVKIDIIKNGVVKKHLFNEVVNKGKFNKIIDISTLTGIVYDMRIVAGNRFIYKKLKLK